MRFLVRLVMRAGAATVLAGLVFGVPALLVYGIGRPLPSVGGPWHEQLVALLTQPPTGRLLLGVVAILTWALWVVFTTSLLAELAGAVRYGLRRERDRVGPMRAVAFVLLTAVATGTFAASGGAAFSPAGEPLHVGLGRLSAPVAVTAEAAGEGGEVVAVHAAVADNASTEPAGRRKGLWDDHATAPPAVAAGSGTVIVQVAQQQYTVEVVKGDTLWDLADAWLGDPFRWPEIYELNRDRYDRGGRMQGGHHIEPTWVLTLPADAKPPESVTPGVVEPEDPEPDGTAPVPQESEPDERLDPPAASPDPALSPDLAAPDAAAFSPDHTDDFVEPDRPLTPWEETDPSVPSESPAAGAAPEVDAADGDPDEVRGIDIPGGGWIALPVVAGIAAAAALVLINRRRGWRPGAAPASDPTPKTLRKLRPATAYAGLGILDEAAAVDDDQEPAAEASPEAAPEASPASASADWQHIERQATTVTETTIGATEQRWLRLTDLPRHGVGLVGSGAAAAVRGLLAAALSSGGPHRPELNAEAIATTELLSQVEITDPQHDRLTVAATVEDALDLLHIEVNRRFRQAGDDITGVGDQVAEPPLLVLLTDVGDAELRRLNALVELGHSLGVHAVLLGEWPDQPTWQVEPDGHAATGGGPLGRLNTITSTIAAELLETLAAARSEPRPPDDALASQVATGPEEPGKAPTVSATPPATGTPARPGLQLRILGVPAVLASCV
jgi:hypothetical protein